jgi:hypothetical protein
MFAYDYPLLGAFWTIFWFVLWIAWLMLLFRTIADIFRSDDLGGWAKALWMIFVVLAPFLGVFVYLIARGGSMTQRDIAQAQAHEQMYRSYVQESAQSVRSADELTKLAELRDRGVISEAEFAQLKAKVLA